MPTLWVLIGIIFLRIYQPIPSCSVMWTMHRNNLKCYLPDPAMAGCRNYGGSFNSAKNHGCTFCSNFNQLHCAAKNQQYWSIWSCHWYQHPRFTKKQCPCVIIIAWWSWVCWSLHYIGDQHLHQPGPGAGSGFVHRGYAGGTRRFYLIHQTLPGK